MRGIAYDRARLPEGDVADRRDFDRLGIVGVEDAARLFEGDVAGSTGDPDGLGGCSIRDDVAGAHVGDVAPLAFELDQAFVAERERADDRIVGQRYRVGEGT